MIRILLVYLKILICRFITSDCFIRLPPASPSQIAMLMNDVLRVIDKLIFQAYYCDNPLLVSSSLYIIVLFTS